MNDEIKAYFFEQYKNAPFVMMLGDIPESFNSKEEVDSWIKAITRACQYAIKNKGRHVEDEDDF